MENPKVGTLGAPGECRKLSPSLLGVLFVFLAWPCGVAEGQIVSCDGVHFLAATVLAEGATPSSVAFGDYTEDGNLDLMILSVSGIVSLAVGNGQGGFGIPFEYSFLSLNGNPSGLVVGDFNGDDHLDLVVNKSSSLNITLFLGNGQGGLSFVGTNVYAGPGIRSLAAGDFDGNGIDDLAVANSSTNEVCVLLGSGGGLFPEDAIAVGPSPQSVAVGDFDGNGALDLAVGHGPSNAVSVLLGNGQGGLNVASSSAAGSGPLAVGDFDGNGALDLVVANGTSSSDVSLFLGDGQGGLSPPTSFVTSSGPCSVAVGDFDGDGALDLAVGHCASTAVVMVLLGDGSGGFSIGSSLGFGESLVVNAATADFNGDGILDLLTFNLRLFRIIDDVSVILGNGQGGFGVASSFAAGNAPRSVAIDDFNGDGQADLAVANASSDNVSVLLGDGQGGLGIASNYTAGNAPVIVLVADFNADSNPDLAVSNGLSDDVSVLLGDGQGGFGPATRFPVGDSPLSMALGDFNGDGLPDLAVVNSNDDDVSVLLGDGQGGLGIASRFTVGDAPLSIAVGEFNGDGHADLAVPNRLSDDVSILLGDGQGGFGNASNFAAGDFPFSIVVGEFNGDGNSDLAVANNLSDDVSLLFGNGQGDFGTSALLAAGDCPHSLAGGDFNGDGCFDLSVSNESNGSSGAISVFLGDGLGGFARAGNFAAGFSPGRITVGDLDGDQRPDIVVPNSLFDQVSVLLNNCAPPDLALESLVNDVGVGRAPLKHAGTGDSLDLRYDSPTGFFVGSPSCLATQFFSTGFPPGSPVGFPEVQLNADVMPVPVVAIEGPLLPTGMSVQGIVPPGLEGFSLIVQGFSVSPSAQNGAFAVTFSHEIRFVSFPAPIIGSVVPVSPPVGEPITIHGAHFSLAAVLTIDGVPIVPTSIARFYIVFDYPAGVACDAVVTVTNPDGQNDFASINPDLAPQISSISPMSGLPGESVTILGDRFLPGATVDVAGTSVTPTTQTLTSIVFPLPGNLICDTTVTVTNACGQSASIGFNPSPTINDVVPSVGATTGGTSVVISGLGFIAGSTVTFGGAIATIGSLTENSISVTTPAGLNGSVPVVVTTTGNCSAVSAFTYVVFPPTISSIIPAFATAGDPVTITGDFFLPGLSLSVGGVPVTPTSVRTSEIIFSYPAGVPCNTVVIVTNPDGQSNSVTFNPCVAPLISSIEPSSAAAGDPITIMGEFFLAGVTLTVAGLPVSLTSVNDTQIVFPYPAGSPCDTTLTLTNLNGLNTSAALNVTPTIASTILDAGPASGGSLFVIQGTGFSPGTTVTIGGTPTMLTIQSTVILVQTPPGTPGPAQVVLTTPGGCTATTTYFYL